ncbi:hypothetical protein LCGC14_1064400 [marine sediment metagenome]|uniref:Multidrug resistance protein MdtA-like barrel-sandwich hybrid domain-containing protein n=1 Tax=marine sediment metagenome TaxID=412755 RepID=A0A0F9Q334_9ZZZZ
MHKKIVFPLVILLLTGLVVFTLVKSKPEVTPQDQPQKRWLVASQQLNSTVLSPEITVYGRVETPRDSTLTSAVEADVLEVLVLEGQTVSQGDELIRLDTTDLLLIQQQREADLAENTADIELEKTRYQRDLTLLNNQKQLVKLADNVVQRAKKLEQNRLTSRASLDEASSSYQQQMLALKQLENDIAQHSARLAQLNAQQQRANALLEQSRVNLSRAVIRAPFDSRVSKLTVAEGDRVRSGDALVNVYDLTNLEVRAQIPGRYVSEIRQMMNNNVPIKAVGLIDGSYVPLSLARLSGEVRVDSGGLDGLFAITDYNDSLPLGTFVEIKLSLEAKNNVFELPFSALYGLDRVYLIENELLKAVSIERVGEVERDGRTFIIVRSDDLNTGDTVVTTQLPNAMTGLRVDTQQ